MNALPNVPPEPDDGYDDLRREADEPKPESWIASKPGDQIAGVVLKLDSGWDRDGNEHGIVVLDAAYSVADGVRSGPGIKSVWLLSEALRNQVLKADLQPGERVLIQYRGKVKSQKTGRVYHDFKVQTDRKVSTWWDRQKASQPPPAGDADPGYAFDDGTPLPPEPDDAPF